MAKHSKYYSERQQNAPQFYGWELADVVQPAWNMLWSCMQIISALTLQDIYTLRPRTTPISLNTENCDIHLHWWKNHIRFMHHHYVKTPDKNDTQWKPIWSNLTWFEKIMIKRRSTWKNNLKIMCNLQINHVGQYLYLKYRWLANKKEVLINESLWNMGENSSV